jgi:hypothetical protein
MFDGPIDFFRTLGEAYREHKIIAAIHLIWATVLVAWGIDLYKNWP